MNKSPAFQFYPKDFLTDEKVIVMHPEVKGYYICLLCIDWLSDGFPANQMAALALFQYHDHHGNFREDDMISIAIAQLSECFIAHPSKSGFITNPKLQKIRKEQQENRKERSASGKKGAKARWNKELPKMAQPSISHGSAIQQPMAKDGSSSSSSSSSNNNTNKISIIIKEDLSPLDLKEFGLFEVKDTFNLWVSYRKEIKKPLKPISLRALAGEYANRPVEFKAAVDHTIAKGWQGLREPEPKPLNGRVSYVQPQKLSHTDQIIETIRIIHDEEAKRREN